jgi:DNA-binding MarR family transcriptional regulator
MFIAASSSEAQSNRQMNQMSGGHKPGFTPPQGQYLAFIDAYTRVNLRPPAEADIQRRFGVTPPSVHQMILALERSGLIRRQPGVPRSIEVLVPPQQLPVLEMPAQPVKTSVPRY